MTKESVVGFFLDLGGENADEHFSPYVWGKAGLGRIIDEALDHKVYGKNLILVLVMYHVTGELTPDDNISSPRLSNYSNKNKDIAASFPISLVEFMSFSDAERRKLLVRTIRQAIDMVEDRLGKRGLDIDFERLRRDVRNATNEYLKCWGIEPE